jgi:glycosyltransferase involved in cell wall biosynthesis
MIEGAQTPNQEGTVFNAPMVTTSVPSEAFTRNTLRQKRVAMVVFSSWPADPRPRRAAEALIKEGMLVDVICHAEGALPGREDLGQLKIFRIPVRHNRGGKLSYVYQYSAFIFVSAMILAWRSVRRRYDLVHVHNMPDILVLSALFPKLLGAKVILDQHDPMPELIMTIFNVEESSFEVRTIRRLEKWSMGLADFVITVNRACKRMFAERACRPEKIGIVMNSPDGGIFRYRAAHSCRAAQKNGAKRFVVMYHGSIVERNGLDLAVSAFSHLKNQIPSAELRIFGRRTPFLDQVLEKAYSLGLRDRISYQGSRTLEELVPEIEACDVGIIPNQRNRFTDINTPTRIFEYLALGKPVIAPRTPGIQDYFDPDSLLFFEAGDARDLAEKIKYVYANSRETIECAARGQKIYLAHTWEQERRKFVQMVRDLLIRDSSITQEARFLQAKLQHYSSGTHD